MMRHDQQAIFTALAFVTVLLQDGNDINDGSARKINLLARLISEFCAENITRSDGGVEDAYVDDKSASKIDTAIEQHIKRLREQESTVLPEDRETLIQFYDRLQQRKARRMQWMFYAQATKEKLADLILRYLDEEIEGRGSAS